MKNTFVQVLLLVILFTSCKTLQVNELKKTKDVKEVGIEWVVDERVNPLFEEKIDSQMNAEILRFNSESHSFLLRKKQKKDKDYVTVEFTKGKLITTGGKIFGLTFSLLGLVALPVYLVSVESPVIFVVGYIPFHSLDFSYTLSPDLGSSNSRTRQRNVGTFAIFTNNTAQSSKMLVRFGNNFQQTMRDIEVKLTMNK